MDKLNQYIMFTLDEQRFALYLSVVERIIRAVEVTPLPQAPEVIHGVINVQGRIIPVADIRKRFKLPCREIDLNDRFIIARTSRRTIVLVADAVDGIVERLEQEIIAAEEILSGMSYVEGAIRLADGIMLILDLDRLLSLEEEQSMDNAVKEKKKELQ